MKQVFARIWFWLVAVVIVGFLAAVILLQITPPRPPIPTVIELSSTPALLDNQIFVAQMQNLSLNGTSPRTGVSQPVNIGSLLNFENGESFQTSSGNGYAYLEFPGHAQVYLAGDTAITLKNLSDKQFEILLSDGWILIYRPGRKFLVDTPNGAQAWVVGSMIGLHFDAGTQELYVDCLEDTCGISGYDQPLPQGSHSILNGNQIVAMGVGIHSEYWQFVPSLLSTPTSTLTPPATTTLTLTPLETPQYLNSRATQICYRSQIKGTPCP